MIAYKVLIVSNGIIVLADITEDDVVQVKSADVMIGMNTSGLVIKAAHFHIPIPESVLDFLIDNRNITIYPFSSRNYVEEALLNIALSREAIIEARGIYNFWKKNNV
ncbi:MAG: hypothetical protein M0Z67_02275 [Nitrospiraceae bacterium]|nr:hypothetical protein [Nitrospiraceae bacterium]